MGTKTAVRGVLSVLMVVSTASVAFAQTTKSVFVNNTPNTIPTTGHAAIYPSSLNVTGVAGVIYHVSVTIGFGGPQQPDLDILLQAPNGHAVMLMSDAGSLGGRQSIGFDDCAPLSSKPGGVPLLIRYRPTNFPGGDSDVMDTPAPPAPYGNILAEFNGITPNGTWQLYVMDDNAATQNGGTIESWRLTFFTQPVGPHPHDGANPLSCSQPDYDGDGRIDIAVYRPETGEWFISQSGSSGATAHHQFGASARSGLDDIAVPADYDGDGLADVAVYRRSTGGWWSAHSLSGFIENVTFGSASHLNLGDVPVPGDYDGDGRANQAIYRSTTGEWFVNKSGTASPITPWGYPPAGDYPAR
jgi:subtilisin-like proprotein convertase family protein